jgi:hypothetical protein
LRDGLELAVLTNADKVSIVPLAKSIFAAIEPAKDVALVATLSQPPINEDPATTDLVRLLGVAIERAHPLGNLQLVEFIEAQQREGTDYVTYRLTYDAGQYLMTLGLRGGKIAGVTFEPAH